MELAESATGPAQERAIARLNGAPPIKRYALLYWNAFWTLGTTRPVAVSGRVSIPFTAILAYADEYRYEGRMRTEFIRIIQRLDAHYCSLSNRRAAERSKR